MGTEGFLPSMFHRRLVLLTALSFVPVGLVCAQLVRLTLVEGEKLEAEAEAKLVITRWEPTTRGRILDRNGRVLAQDRPSFDVAIDYPVMSGEWAESMGGQTARTAFRETWDQLGPGQKDALLTMYRKPFDDYVDAAWEKLAAETGIDREVIDERAGDTTRRVNSMVEWIRDRRLARELEDLEGRGRQITTEVEAELVEDLSKQRLREQNIAHPILHAVDDELAFHLMRLADQTTTLVVDPSPGARPVKVDVPLVPGLAVVGSSTREYPFAEAVVDVDMTTFPPPLRVDATTSVTVEGVATQLLGWMGAQSRKEESDRRKTLLASDPAFKARVTTTDAVDRGEYRTGDPAPRAGVEWSLESDLRGLRGLRVLNLETGVEQEIEPSPGRDVRLTIDLALQSRIQAVMDPALGLAKVQPWHHNKFPSMKPGTPFHGSAVVIEVDTGQILAMVSTPSFTRDQLQDDPDSIFKDPVGAPWVNKAINKPYPPGSIAKAIVISEAISRAKLGLDEHIACTGHLYENRNDILRCWIYRPEFNMTTHSAVLGHDLDAVDALTVSCNIFSYTVGRRLGPEGITEVYRDFGVDVPLDLGVGEQFNGHVGLFGNDPPPITPFDATLMGMGQGPITWTPLHAANAFATLARGGVWVEPRIIDDGRPPVVRDLELDPRAIGVALQGLHNVVNDSAHGTAYSINYADAGNYPRARIFDVPGVEVWGKTGTAQATEIKVDPDDDPETMNDIILREGDHSWFTALVAPEGERPRYAICVLMEHAGSGGRVSGPICNQIVYALKNEGYLDP